VPAAGPATGEVSPGVHVLQIRGFLTAFVEFADFVAAFDAPASAVSLEAIPAAGRADCEKVTEEYRDAIARLCPGKPVRFVVVSHHHGDHLGGLRAFAGPGVTVLAAPGDVSAVRRALEAPHTLAPDRWSGDGRRVRVEAVTGRRVIGDGGRELEVWRVGENPHTSDNLFAWLARERVLIQGDLFYYEESAPFPPSGRETMNRFFARWLETRGLAPRAVYGVHYPGAAGPEALARAARYRAFSIRRISQECRSARE
jgi:glyoxylase-like metal-dependent hydrolase (beta-lactamase superfamily II)